MAKENQIGALWFPKSENPKAPFAKGSITIGGEKIAIVVWKNKWKEPGESTPDYYIEREAPREQGDRPNHVTQVAETMNRPAQSADDFSDDIPF